MTNTTITAASPREAFQEAVKDIRRQGIKIAQGLRGDGCSCGCSGWKTPASWGNHDNHTNYAFTRAGDVEWNGSGSESVAYWNWGGIDDTDLSTAFAIARTFAFYGFEVRWDGSRWSCVVVPIASWSEDRLGYVPDGISTTDFLIEARSAAVELLRAREAQELAYQTEGLSYDGTALYDAEARASRLGYLLWTVEGFTELSEEMQQAARVAPTIRSEVLSEWATRIDEYLSPSFDFDAV